MLLPDVNVLVYAFRKDARDHAAYRRWLEDLVNGNEAYGVADLVLAGFLRIVTHPRIFAKPTPFETAAKFVAVLREPSNALPVSPGPRHWSIFLELCRGSEARGNLVPDAYLAALAIESGAEWITTDRDYSRFSGLRWRHPLAG